ncbi:hypothetical protein [uncultured Clostridium sp.]|jgi:hypothetical protein|uniref:hypothetical protein n=1 Tax=uncultured Clostridium sp. TaxID=59620 RepID=UPI002610334B|nr:hypothetical protein [uncultured Clostridium sp.]
MGDFSEYRNKYMFSNKRKYYSDVDMGEIKKETKILRGYIKEYRVNLTSVSRDIPDDESRNKLLDVASFIIKEKKIMDHFNEKKTLPKTHIAKKTMIKLSLIDRYIDYLKLYTILLMGEEFKEIVGYLNIQEKDESKKRFKDINSNHKQDVYKGISLQISSCAKSIFILTREGIVADVKYSEGCNSGDEILSTKFTYISPTIKIGAGILGVFLVIGYIVANVYKIPEAKIVLNTTSEINLKVNSFNKVVYVNSPTDKGKVMIETIPIEHKGIDNALLSILKYADSNEMIPENGVIRVSVVGEDFNLKSISKTVNYVESQYIDDTKKGEFFRVEINNDGVQKTVKADKTKEKE